MALASAAAENAATNAVVALAAFLSLHTATPGTTGASEAVGGSYARQAAAWTASSAGSSSNSGALSVPIPATTTVTHFGTWTLVTAGTYEIGGALTSSVTTGSTAGNVTFAVGAVTISSS